MDTATTEIYTLSLRAALPICGDTDTNGAIAGALLGAAWGATAMHAGWADALLACRPQPETPGCRCPRPRAFWPVDFRLLAEHLTALGG